MRGMCTEYFWGLLRWQNRCNPNGIVKAEIVENKETTLQEIVSGLRKRPSQSQSFPVMSLVPVVLRENSPNWLSNGIQEQWLLPSFLLDAIR